MIFEQLITSRVGGGAIGVVSFGLAGGCALSGRGRAWWRRTCGSLAVLSLLLMPVMASDWAPLGTAHGLWVGLYAASLRAFMWEVAGDEARADWAGTFAWVLLPGAIIDTLLGWAEHRRWTDTVPHRCWLAWSPMLFEAVLLQNPLDLLGGSEGGIGLAAVAVPAICMIGGYAIARCGPRWVRSPCGLVALSAIPIWSMTATGVGGSSMSLGDHHGAWAAVLYWGLLATFSMTAAIPNRRPVLSLNRPACPPASPSESAPTMTTYCWSNRALIVVPSGLVISRGDKPTRADTRSARARGGASLRREAGEVLRHLFAGSADDRQLCGTGKVWGIMASWTSPRFGRTSASPASHG